MLRYSIALCFFSFFILLMLIASILVAIFVCRNLRNNLVPYIYMPLLVALGFFFHAYV